tara:strand:- start:478 stop:984 length:507 start_codon:yes stop_codon:yes gene_type:complete
MKELIVKIDNGNYVIAGGVDWGTVEKGEPLKYEANEVRSDFYEELLSYHYDYHMQVTIPFDGAYNVVFKHPGEDVTRTERVCFFSFDKKKRLNVPWSPMPRTNDRSSLDGQFSISVESYTDVQVVHMSHRTFVAVAESVVQDLLALNQGLLIPCVCTRQMRECFPFMY